MLDVEKPILEYVLQNSTPRDTILELPFGGGMSFATGRNQPTYSTLFIQLRPSKAIQMEDFKRLTARPPAVVIARADRISERCTESREMSDAFSPGWNGKAISHRPIPPTYSRS